MKKLKILFIVLLIFFNIGYLLLPKKIESNYANQVTLIAFENQENEKKVTITDENDILALKEIMQGSIWFDSGASCGFGKDFLTIQISNGNKTTNFCPALDGCEIIYVDEHNKYFEITDENREKLNEILKKYGFPISYI